MTGVMLFIGWALSIGITIMLVRLWDQIQDETMSERLYRAKKNNYRE